ncbi:hypothetical protein [Cesiribacter andamanensis]|uniref:Secreted protein n=1 Tax=Cesiribacter andamanensis AMV16 TaxID=1279009 RepID=M7N054_9BACT|nr:hypothetical protein [Cesiribacter andamanensis]EMR00677.1 hypothetical protein ADICEAN_04197 [Cesiribacter andamanensis AMV16]
MKNTNIPTTLSKLLSAAALSGLLFFSACGDGQNTETTGNEQGYAKDQDPPLREIPAADTQAGGVPTENVADRSPMAQTEADSAAGFERTANTPSDSTPEGSQTGEIDAQLNQNQETSTTYSTDPTRTINSSGHPMEITPPAAQGQQQKASSQQRQPAGKQAADTTATQGQQNQTPPGTSPRPKDQ